MPTKPTVKAYQGDMKTLLAFDLPKSATTNLAGFTIRCTPGGQQPYYLLNSLRFERPGDHAQDAAQPATSSVNAPFHKFRWLHVPGSFHQGLAPAVGPYTYSVTPRYFDDHGSLLPLDGDRAQDVKINVGPFKKKGLSVAFTRGYVQSEAFTHHFGLKALIRPAGKALMFDTSKIAGQNAAGQEHSFLDEYEWMGASARKTIFDLVEDVVADKTLRLDVFAYDLNEPDFVTLLLKLAAQKRIRVILDNAKLHHGSPPTPEDQFARQFAAKAGSDAIVRGKFGRYAHDKVLIVRQKANGTAVKVLTGSTNFSVTGLYVNSNHVLVFDDPKVAARYANVFDTAWQGKATTAFSKTPVAATSFPFDGGKTPTTEITFSPHGAAFAETILDGVAARIAKEGKTKGGSVLFAVMALNTGGGPVLPALRNIHKNQDIFSYGISDSPGGIELFARGHKTGVLVTGKPGSAMLPPPFDQVPGVGQGHQVHHKFVVCGFNGKDPVVYCGSSNLALGGEKANGDNLIAIRDADVATAFAIEAVALVDHFEFLDRSSSHDKAAPRSSRRKLPTNQRQAAADAGWFLSTDDRWTQPYYDEDDLHCVDRELFA